jgi:hypothetical protein
VEAADDRVLGGLPVVARHCPDPGLQTRRIPDISKNYVRFCQSVVG